MCCSCIYFKFKWSPGGTGVPIMTMFLPISNIAFILILNDKNVLFLRNAVKIHLSKVMQYL